MTPPLGPTLAAFVLLLVAVWTDLRGRTIPDTIPIALVVLALLATAFGWHAVSFAGLGLGLAIGFGLGALLFYGGAMGGGDAKLCAGLGAFCGWSRLLEVLFATALCGGVLAYWAKRRGQRSLPYAPAFAAGYAVTVVIAWTLAPTGGLWELITGRST